MDISVTAPHKHIACTGHRATLCVQDFLSFTRRMVGLSSLMAFNLFGEEEERKKNRSEKEMNMNMT